MSASSPRRRARELALQGLYERQVGRADVDVIGSDLRASPGFGRADEVYFDELWRGISSQYDALIARCSPKLSRPVNEVSPVERAILVIGTWELEHRLDIPYRVVINEAVELAKDYGGTDGHKFVNGVLDKLAPELRGAEIAAARSQDSAARD